MYLDMPYFMTNENWYKFDVNAGKIVLTAEATEKAKQSYAEYYNTLEKEGKQWAKLTKLK